MVRVRERHGGGEEAKQEEGKACLTTLEASACSLGAEGLVPQLDFSLRS